MRGNNPAANNVACRLLYPIVAPGFRISLFSTLTRTGIFHMNHTFTVTGMTCGHCEKAVTRAIKQLDPQAEVTIDRASNQVVVQSAQPREPLGQAIAEQGYLVAA